jgi:cardiolipin synthase
MTIGWDELKPWLGGLWAAYLVVLACWIVLQKREPIATLSWLLSLAALPVIGLLIYHFFGPQRINRHRMSRARARQNLGRLPPELSPSEDARTVARLARAATGFAPSTARRVDLLVGGGQCYTALLEAIAGAQHHLHVEYYIFAPDRSGTAFRDALAERARAGVRVRLLLDAIGSGRLSRRFLEPLRNAGVEIAWFHPMKMKWIWRPRMNLRNHRKLVIVDGTVAFTGGINICDDQDERVNSAAFRDMHLRLEGEVVRWLQLAFLEDWHYASKVALRDQRLWPAAEAGEILAQVIPAGPDSPWEAIHKVQVEAIHQADHRVWLVTPYFVPGEAALMALCSAAQRGLDVRVIVPRRSDSRIVTWAARSYYDALLEAGVRVFEYQPGMLHSKAILFDDDNALIGSANFDHRSFRLNFELALLLHDAGFCRQLQAELEANLAASVEVRADRPKAPLRRRLAEAWARLASPLL